MNKIEIKLLFEDKAERINQLKEWGYNTPKVTKIAYGTKYDKILYQKLKKFAGSAEKMTVRTYSRKDEMKESKLDFFPEIPTEEAIRIVEKLVSKYNVLFQEAIDVNTTLITGRIALIKDGKIIYEILKGHYRVREVDNPPPGATLVSKKFNSIYEVKDIEMRRIIYNIRDILNLVVFPNGVIIEFNLQEELIGELKENLIIWEYRPY